MNMFAGNTYDPAEINSLLFAFIFTKNDWQLVLHFMAVLQKIDFEMEVSM